VTIIGKSRSAVNASRALREFVLPSAMVFTDDWAGYDPLNRLGYKRHRRINHTAKVYVDGDTIRRPSRASSACSKRASGERTTPFRTSGFRAT
jgi:hypothetical protein